MNAARCTGRAPRSFVHPGKFLALAQPGSRSSVRCRSAAVDRASRSYNKSPPGEDMDPHLDNEEKSSINAERPDIDTGIMMQGGALVAAVSFVPICV